MFLRLFRLENIHKLYKTKLEKIIPITLEKFVNNKLLPNSMYYIL